MILESVEHGPLIWLTIEENRVAKIKKYVELSATKKIQADCNLIDKAGKKWKMYDRFDNFTINTKFLNKLPPEWSKFVTDVKLVKDLHTTNFDQLHAYLQQHELYANEVLFIQQSSVNQQTYQSSYNNPQFQQQFSPSQSPQYGSIHPTQHYSTTYPSTPLAITYPTAPYPNAYSSTVHQEACPQPQYVPQIEYIVFTVNQQTHLVEFPQIDYGLAVPVFKQGDNPIDAINKMMSFMSTVVTSRFPSTNNQLRNSSNPRQQATIHDGRKSCHTERFSYTTMQTYQADDLDAYDSDCDEISTAKAVLMANLSSYGSDVLSEEKESLTTTLNVLKNESKEKESKNIDNEIALEKKVKELDNIKAQQIRPMLYDGNVIAKETNVISIADSEKDIDA
ncbi:hypothetical protein Tco_0129309 [Tanacetum coccineum]